MCFVFHEITCLENFLDLQYLFVASQTAFSHSLSGRVLALLTAHWTSQSSKAHASIPHFLGSLQSVHVDMTLRWWNVVYIHKVITKLSANTDNTDNLHRIVTHQLASEIHSLGTTEYELLTCMTACEEPQGSGTQLYLPIETVVHFPEDLPYVKP